MHAAYCKQRRPCCPDGRTHIGTLDVCTAGGGRWRVFFPQLNHLAAGGPPSPLCTAGGPPNPATSPLLPASRRPRTRVKDAPGAVVKVCQSLRCVQRNLLPPAHTHEGSAGAGLARSSEGGVAERRGPAAHVRRAASPASPGRPAGYRRACRQAWVGPERGALRRAALCGAHLLPQRSSGERSASSSVPRRLPPNISCMATISSWPCAAARRADGAGALGWGSGRAGGAREHRRRRQHGSAHGPCRSRLSLAQRSPSRRPSCPRAPPLAPHCP